MRDNKVEDVSNGCGANDDTFATMHSIDGESRDGLISDGVERRDGEELDEAMKAVLKLVLDDATATETSFEDTSGSQSCDSRRASSTDEEAAGTEFAEKQNQHPTEIVDPEDSLPDVVPGAHAVQGLRVVSEDDPATEDEESGLSNDQESQTSDEAPVIGGAVLVQPDTDLEAGTNERLRVPDENVVVEEGRAERNGQHKRNHSKKTWLMLCCCAFLIPSYCKAVIF